MEEREGTEQTEKKTYLQNEDTGQGAGNRPSAEEHFLTPTANERFPRIAFHHGH